MNQYFFLLLTVLALLFVPTVQDVSAMLSSKTVVGNLLFDATLAVPITFMLLILAMLSI